MAGGRACDPPSPRLLLLILLLLIPPSRACMETVLQNGTMADAELVVPQLTVPSSCACCALCHHHDTCSSISFNAVSGACRLYSSVPDFSRITVDADSALFVRPGRSNHLQFCRHDSDCVDPAAAGDRCHGRVCTDDLTVTCRDLAETMGAPMNDVYYGSLDGVTTKYYCASHSGIDGWTLISRMTGGKGSWSRTNMMQRNVDSPDNPTYSQLFRANDLRAAGVDTTFQILILFDTSVGFYGTVPVQQSLEVNTYTGSSSVTSVTLIGALDAGKAVLPWMPPSGAALLSLVTAQGSAQYFNTVLNTPGQPYLGSPHTTSEYFVRE